MNEKVISFGFNDELNGILTLPTSDKIGERKDALLFLNAGLLHRTGFHRFNTETARLLSQKGYASLRFDLHGLGDSAKHDGKVPIEQQAITDITAAITTLLENTGANKCILIGLCSGADYAHIVAHKDPRISGAVLIDGYAYPTLLFYFKDCFPGIINPFKVVRFAYRLVKKKFISLKSNVSNTEIYMREFPKKKQIIGEIQQIVDRNVKLYYIYSGGIPVYYNYKNQFFHMFRSIDFKGNITHSYFKEADHTFTNVVIRYQLMENIANWISDFSR